MERRFPGTIPEVLGTIALLATLVFIVLLGSLGPMVKDPFWMAIWAGYTGLLCMAALATVGMAAWRAWVRRRFGGLVAPSFLAALLLVIDWGALYPSYMSAREETFQVPEVFGFSRALVQYIEGHDGSFPGSLQDLVQGGYISKGTDGTWVVPVVSGQYPCKLRDPTWFDVTWGIHSSQVEPDGHVKGQDRLVVQPAPNVPARRFDSVCRAISRNIGTSLSSQP